MTLNTQDKSLIQKFHIIFWQMVPIKGLHLRTLYIKPFKGIVLAPKSWKSQEDRLHLLEVRQSGVWWQRSKHIQGCFETFSNYNHIYCLKCVHKWRTKQPESKTSEPCPNAGWNLFIYCPHSSEYSVRQKATDAYLETRRQWTRDEGPHEGTEPAYLEGTFSRSLLTLTAEQKHHRT